jgi:hypothetical protein
MSKIPNTNRAGGMAKGVDPKFKPQYHKKKKRCMKARHGGTCL